MFKKIKFLKKLYKKSRVLLLVNLNRYTINSYNLKNIYLTAEKFYTLVPSLKVEVIFLFIFAGLFNTLSAYFLATSQIQISIILKVISRLFFIIGAYFIYKNENLCLVKNQNIFNSLEFIFLKKFIVISFIYKNVVILLLFFFVAGRISSNTLETEIKISTLLKEQEHESAYAKNRIAELQLQIKLLKDKNKNE